MLTENEIERLKQAIIATIASPVIGSIEDYTWEAIFHYIKDIPLSDPALGRSKLLYDAVDATTATGWSLKSLQKQLFRSRIIPSEAVRIRLERNRLTLDRYVQTVLSALQAQLSMQPPDSLL
jgi:hypothetical protein